MHVQNNTSMIVSVTAVRFGCRSIWSSEKDWNEEKRCAGLSSFFCFLNVIVEDLSAR